MVNQKCTICRRIGQKLFLKGERCFSAKCAIIKKPYAPGSHKRRMRRGMRRGLSEYGIQLAEKQKVKSMYCIREKQFKNYVLKCLKTRKENKSFPDFFAENLELRLDNVVFRLGFANSRKLARQLVAHRHFLVNFKAMNRPSFQLTKGDTIQVRPKSLEKTFFERQKPLLKKYRPPSWLSLEWENFKGKILEFPTVKETNIPVDLQVIAEFYSR